MKIEMGESLLYSWLRHVKECHIVQTNWKVSPQWELIKYKEVTELREKSESAFKSKLNYSIYKDISLEQFLAQAEVDVFGISLYDNKYKIYAVDVAFHESGLNYGSKDESVTRVIKKCLRTAMCIYGYLNITDGEIIFASPKIHNSVYTDLVPAVELCNQVLQECGLDFSVRIIANEEFESKILSPILVASQGVSDTSELFLRSYQMYKMFAQDTYIQKTKQRQLKAHLVSNDINTDTDSIAIMKTISYSSLQELKVGRIANTILRNLLEDGQASDEEIEKMQTLPYSKLTFHLNYPLLVKASELLEKVRYYTKPLRINGDEYYLCSQWFETPTNNDKPDLLKWIALHQMENGSSKAI